jgi:hypothetical protein
MAKKSEIIDMRDARFDPLLRTQNLAYGTTEMRVCEGCGRRNGASRLKCIYCAHDLDLRPEQNESVGPILRSLESWEHGFNLIIVENVCRNLPAAAKFLSLETEALRSILNTGVPLPVVRVDNEQTAGHLRDGIEKFGFRSLIVADADLATETPPGRLRSLEIDAAGLVVRDFNTGTSTAIARDELAVMVIGLIRSGRVDSTERRRRGGKVTTLDEVTSASDEMVLDIYRRSDPVGFRVNLTGFDFSCLGDEKGILAGENLLRLIVRLRASVPNAKFIDSYGKIRAALGLTWEVDSRRASFGLRRAGVGKIEFGAVASRSNLNQFTKFSRLQWHLL